MGKYWLIPIDDRMYKSMMEIGVELQLILNLIKVRDYIKMTYNDDYIYMAVRDNNWEYTPTENKYDGNDIYNRWGYKYMGPINISDVELSIKKYNI